jgi:hypothetical protein
MLCQVVHAISILNCFSDITSRGQKVRNQSLYLSLPPLDPFLAPQRGKTLPFQDTFLCCEERFHLHSTSRGENEGKLQQEYSRIVSVPYILFVHGWKGYHNDLNIRSD